MYREDVVNRPVAWGRHAEPGAAFDHIAAEPRDLEAVTPFEALVHRGGHAGSHIDTVSAEAIERINGAPSGLRGLRAYFDHLVDAMVDGKRQWAA
jgi:hypothetical protein